jgi:hypothetical protein
MQQQPREERVYYIRWHVKKKEKEKMLNRQFAYFIMSVEMREPPSSSSSLAIVVRL